MLVVEDNDDVRDMMTVTLELEGHKVITTSNGREALEVLRHGITPCVVLLDLMMPVMNGWEFTAALRADPKFKDLPVVVISAAGVEIPAATGAAAYLTKPIDIDKLLNVVGFLCLKHGAQADPSAINVTAAWRRE
ncbi:MAG: response regulator [Tepidisphaeraceae bacterium]